MCLWQAIPSQAVCQGGGARHVAFPIDDAAIAARTQRPERGGGAWQIQTDVPERVYRRGNATVGNRMVPYPSKGSQINSFSLALGGHSRYLILRALGSPSPLEGTQR